MLMFNDIQHEKECEPSALLVALYAKDFQQDNGLFGSGSKK